jgi:hypothetical protein
LPVNTVLIVVAIAFFVVVAIALLFVSRDGGTWRFGFKLGKHFRAGASGAGRGASIVKSTSTHGGATAIDKTGHSASISETTTKGELTAEVSDAASDVKKKS